MATDPLRPLNAPELVFGLVSPIGADLELVIDVLTSELRNVNYTADLVRISDIFSSIKETKDLLNFRSEEKRIDSHMSAGTWLREKFGRGDILSLFALAKIREIREKKTGSEKSPAERHSYIVRSIKHKDEVDAFRKIYGKGFVLISVFSPRESRIQRLAKAIAVSNSDTDSPKYREIAERLIIRDEAEEGRKLGQGVTDAFPLADFFLTSEERSNVQESIERFIKILFGYPFHTPSYDELGMFQARSSALRSADLSRQVGSCITTEDSEIIAVGCNEVPKAFGGIYPSKDGKDKRDFQVGFDSNAKIKREIISETIDRFKKAKWFKRSIEAKETRKLALSLIDGDNKSILRDAQIMNILEFGRIVHAEMNALMDAARRGNAVGGGVLYCTTFPCHMCARHIIAAGIKRVVYIEPYPKSFANELYPDEISTDGDGVSDGRVEFAPFVGVAPRRFHEFFEMPIRKNSLGDAVKWSPQDACPAFERYLGTYLELEEDVLDALPEMLSEKGVHLAH